MKPRFFVPEVLQSSAMDCGPASLKALLGGFGLSVNYARLRDLCRTGADGTSIDALEDLATSLGFEAHQEIGPAADAAALVAARAPCIVVMKLPSGAPHFVVVWRALGPWLQIMDPARGRSWVHRDRFSRELYVHTQFFDDGDAFVRWFASTEWCALTRRRLAKLDAASLLPDRLGTGKRIGAVDASARLVERLVSAGAIRREALAPTLERLVEAELVDEVVPSTLRAVLPAEDGTVAVRGVVFLMVRDTGTVARDESAERRSTAGIPGIVGTDLPSPARVLRDQLSRAGTRTLALLSILSALIALVTLGEVVLVRAAFNARTLLSLPQQRFAGTVLYGAVVLLLLALETMLAGGVERLSLALEVRTRLALLRKLPRLPDRYFRTRPMSEVAHRSNGLFHVKALPTLIVRILRQAMEITVSVIALAMIYPRGAPFIALALFFGLVVPYLGVRARWQIETRVQAHGAALAHLYLDVLLGLVPLRAHGGEFALRAKQEAHLVDWRRASTRTVELLSTTEIVQGAGTLLAVVGLLHSYVATSPDQALLLLMVFWALQLPVHARSFAATIQRLPTLLASMGRLVDPLTADETAQPESAPTETTLVLSRRPGIALRFDAVRVVLSSTEVLSKVSLEIRAGEHVAVVGQSGAGKSSLLAAILGILELDAGTIHVDGRPAAEFDVARLRRETVWVDPAVQLWDKSLVENLFFGNPASARNPLDTVVDGADLDDLLERLPRGMATELGESGCRVSGGEGQRVRLGRALLRRGARLILLDEAFRGLERKARRRMSRLVRKRSHGATVIEVTHDVAETRDFHRIVVIEDGIVVEQGSPEELLASPGSRYAALVAADRAAEHDVWEAPHWKRLWVENGSVSFAPRKETADA